MEDINFLERIRNNKMEIDIETLIYKEPKDFEPHKGDLLIASPILNSPYFTRSVVLLLEDNEKGHLGLTLNVPTPVTLQDIFPEWIDGKKVKVYSGGPVESDRLFMVHTLGDRFAGAMEISDGLYVGADLDQVMEYIHNEEDLEGKIRFFLGYSGWEKDQLAGEIMEGSWVASKAKNMYDGLTGSGNNYWRREVEKLGKEYRSWLLIPRDAHNN